MKYDVVDYRHSFKADFRENCTKVRKFQFKVKVLLDIAFSEALYACKKRKLTRDCHH